MPDQYHHGDLKNALIKAGAEVLAREGLSGLSLRKVAQQAGVSHAAPYAHFADKQALIAAISTEGYGELYRRLSAVMLRCQDAPLSLIVESAWTYMAFAFDDPARFHVTFSGAVEKEKEYPALVEATEKNFQAVVQIVSACQAAGVLNPAPPDLMAVSIWGAIHGLVLLILDGQISHTVLERCPPSQMLLHTLRQFCRVELPADLLAARHNG